MNTLQQAQKLTPDDLAANRGGRLSEAQKRRFFLSTAVFLSIFGLALVVIVGVMVASLFVVPMPLVVIAIFSLPLYFVVRVLLKLRIPLALRREEFMEGVVSSTTGVAGHIHMSPGANLMIDDLHLLVPTPVLELIEPGERYRVYYLPRSKTFILVEKV
jgi:hypothetical protein